MKIIPNIPGAFKLYGALRHLSKYKNNIERYKAEGNYEKERENIQSALSIWSNNLLDIFDAEMVIHGEENIPKEGPVVFMGNHQGYADIIVYSAALSKNIAFGYVAKDELEKVPLYGTWIRRIRSVLIKREDPRASLRAIEEAVDYVNKGFSMMIFPEGTRSRSSEMGEFKRGAFKLATKPGVPIIPVSINGTYRMYEETGVIRGARVDIMVHPPIETAGIDRKGEKQLCLDVENTVRQGLEQLIKIQEESNA